MGGYNHSRADVEEASVATPIDMAVIDYAALQASGKERDAALKQLDEAFQTYGFAYLANHSISQDLVDEAFSWSKRLFALPFDVKMKAEHPVSGRPEHHRGYAKEGIGHTTQLLWDANEIEKNKTSAHEPKETFEMANPFDYSRASPNRWIPEADLPGFRAFQERWWAECTALSQNMLGKLGEALHLQDADALCKLESRDDAHVSLMYYPQMPIEPLHSRRQHRLNAHTDYGSLTLLFNDHVGGLEVHDGEVYRPVVPKRGTIVLNVGDMLERQTNGRWKSSLHQVTAPRETMMQKGFRPTDSVVDRYAIVYFGQPNPEVIVDVLPGCESPGKWQPIMIGDWEDKMTCYDWLHKRYQAEFA